MKARALCVVVVLGACSRAPMSRPEPESSRARPAAAQASGPTRDERVGTNPGHVGAGTPLSPEAGHELAAFAAGCFWGVEDTFRQVPGVVSTAVGYSGGHTSEPTYESVCTHTTGHAETVLIEFDPKKVSYEALLNVFFKNHNPTTLNRQGPDVGDQYRSAIFTFSSEQASKATEAKAREQAERKKTVVTSIQPIGPFWKAEEYHQQYDEKTGTHSCPLPLGLPGHAT